MQRPSPRFRSREYFVLEISEETFAWRRHADAYPGGHQHGGRKPTETSVTEFCYKSVSLHYININLILFLIYELFR